MTRYTNAARIIIKIFYFSAIGSPRTYVYKYRTNVHAKLQHTVRVVRPTAAAAAAACAGAPLAGRARRPRRLRALAISDPFAPLPHTSPEPTRRVASARPDAHLDVSHTHADIRTRVLRVHTYTLRDTRIYRVLYKCIITIDLRTHRAPTGTHKGTIYVYNRK